MTDLIFHIGFPKCASTTLQKTVFPTDPGYIGTYPSTGRQVKGRINYAKQFQNLSPIGVKLRGNIKQAERWKKRVLEYKETHVPQVNRLIISSEFFTQKNRIKNRPIIDFLKEFNQTLWDAGNIKIVVVIRNQSDIIASGYAQDSNTNPRVSQADFERYIDRFLKKHGSVIFYSEWVQELQEAFKIDNVQVLLMEDIGTIGFWSDLKSFCSLKEFEPGSMLNRERSHVKRTGSSSWSVQPFNYEFKAKVYANNLLRMVWPHHIKKELRESARLSLINKLTLYFEKRYNGLNSEAREEEIFLSEDIKNAVRSYYRDSNLKLSELLGRDVTTLGY